MKKAFTLLELIVVVIIMSILISIAIPRFQGAIEKSRSAEAISILGMLRKAQYMYYSEYGAFSPGFHNVSLVNVAEPNARFFSSPTICSPGSIAHPPDEILAIISRNSVNNNYGIYTLFISDQGNMYCSPPSSSDVCERIGIPRF